MSEVKRSKIGLSTMYGVGLVRKGPGTAGSAVAAILAWMILMLPHGWGWLALGTVLFTILGTFSATRYMITHNTAHDPSEIIIDELAGQWLTYLIWFGMIAGASLPQQVTLAQLEVEISPGFMLLGFALFRLFDILKPWPISWADRKIGGGWGVMFDDLLAAIPAGIFLYALYVVSPLVLGTTESIP